MCQYLVAIRGLRGETTPLVVEGRPWVAPPMAVHLAPTTAVIHGVPRKVSAAMTLGSVTLVLGIPSRRKRELIRFSTDFSLITSLRAMPTLS